MHAHGTAVTIARPTHTLRLGWPRRLVAFASVAILTACAPQTTPSPGGSASPSPGTSPTAPATLEPTATPDLGLTLPPPPAIDPTAISYTLTVEINANESGRLVVTVTNLSQRTVPELVLRWPTAVRDTVFLAPFEPSQQRIREGGDPLVQDWTKWVDGPGEHGEPVGTTSLGWGPLLAGGTLTIPILATRVAPGPVAFDFQILDGEAALLSGGAMAQLRVTVP
jgi:hypothetical protein